jgi:hypothetical protein
MSETNKHPGGQKIISMHFERLKNWPINPAVAIYCTDLEDINVVMILRSWRG